MSKKAAARAGKRSDKGVAKFLADIKAADNFPPAPKSSRDISLLLPLKGAFDMEFWAEGWVLANVDDRIWKSLTASSEIRFPATLRRDHFSHPAYIVREIGESALDIVPLSTSRQAIKLRIPAGSQFELTGHVTEKDSYLVLGAISRINRVRGRFKPIPTFLGLFPPRKLDKS